MRPKKKYLKVFEGLDLKPKAYSWYITLFGHFYSIVKAVKAVKYICWLNNWLKLSDGLVKVRSSCCVFYSFFSFFPWAWFVCFSENDWGLAAASGRAHGAGIPLSPGSAEISCVQEHNATWSCCFLSFIPARKAWNPASLKTPHCTQCRYCIIWQYCIVWQCTAADEFHLSQIQWAMCLWFLRCLTNSARSVSGLRVDVVVVNPSLGVSTPATLSLSSWWTHSVRSVGSKCVLGSQNSLELFLHISLAGTHRPHKARPLTDQRPLFISSVTDVFLAWGEYCDNLFLVIQPNLWNCESLQQSPR